MDAEPRNETLSAPRVHHLTFCTPDYAGVARELRLSAAKWGLTTRTYTPRHPAVTAVAKAHPEIMRQARGAGYWLWKPAILLDTLNAVPDGDVVFYTDAGMTLIRDPRELFERATDEAPSVLFEHATSEDAPDFFKQSRWTKRDCFVLMDADRPEFWNATQVIAGFQMHRNGAKARALVSEWLRFASDDRILTDRPNTMGAPNLEGFVEHRHDQSILTNLAVKYGIVGQLDPCDEHASQPRIVDLHRRRGSYLESFAAYRATAGLRRMLQPRRRIRALATFLRLK
jgi:hypothetical protein